MSEGEPITREQTMRPEFVRQHELSEFRGHQHQALEHWIKSLDPETNVAELLSLMDIRGIDPKILIESISRLNAQFRRAAERQGIKEVGEFFL